jgi:hypothetical protein
MFWAGLVTDRNLLRGLEAAIGIEPMNKGFAVMKSLFSCVPVCHGTCGFVGGSEISRACLFTEMWDCFD